VDVPVGCLILSCFVGDTTVPIPRNFLAALPFHHDFMADQPVSENHLVIDSTHDAGALVDGHRFDQDGPQAAGRMAVGGFQEARVVVVVKQAWFIDLG